MKIHQPKHIYLNNTVYFVTVSTYQKQKYLDNGDKKAYLLYKIREIFDNFKYQLYAWVILNNHYHLLFKSKLGKDLSKIIGTIHGNSSHYFNEIENKQGRRLWQSYWDRCVRDVADFYRHFNYIHHNPVKHGYVIQMEDYNFSSFNYWIKKKGIDWVYSIFKQYPILDYTAENDDFQ